MNSNSYKDKVAEKLIRPENFRSIDICDENNSKNEIKKDDIIPKHIKTFSEIRYLD